jgi:hypothetical protein
MKKLISILLISFLSASANASLAGDWTGWGTWTFKGDGVACNPMTMKWVESADQISVVSGLFDCQVVAMHLGETIWKIKDGKLFDETGVEVGTYDGMNFEADMASPNENTTIHISVKRAANHYDYQEVWFNQYEKIYIITGRLFTSGE